MSNPPRHRCHYCSGDIHEAQFPKSVLCRSSCFSRDKSHNFWKCSSFKYRIFLQKMYTRAKSHITFHSAEVRQNSTGSISNSPGPIEGERRPTFGMSFRTAGICMVYGLIDDCSFPVSCLYTISMFGTYRSRESSPRNSAKWNMTML